ncbi:MAG: DinB family protein [Armatimonadetes bacterium]|nr:DinB family protein [Armatimonadota bacterium]
MDVVGSIKGQYHAGLKMLRQCVEVCPESVWIGGKHPRNPWRIAYHALFYTHLYMLQAEADYVPWEKHRDQVTDLWEDANPPVVSPYTREEMLSYLDEIDRMVEPTLDALDWEAESTGFHWYDGERDFRPTMNKLDLEIMNLRHLQGHVGQLSEILMEHGIDIDWMGKSAPFSAE